MPNAALGPNRGGGVPPPWHRDFWPPLMRGGGEPRAISVDVSGTRKLRLYRTDARNGINRDHAVWADARLVSPE